MDFMKGAFLYLVLLCLLITPAISQGRIYKWVDQNGAEHYSTKPPPKKLHKNCKDHIELYSSNHLSKIYRKSETWVLKNVRINLWEKETSKGKGRKVGTMLPGSRALILNVGQDDYRVQSPLDKSIGWVNKVHIKRILKQNIKTREPCP